MPNNDLIPLDALKARYGAWALIAGGTEGLGRAYADTLAAAGINLLLVARRQALLDEVAGQIEQAHGVSVVAVAADLAAPDAADRLVAAVGDRDLGLVIYNAGGDTACTDFLSRDMTHWSSLIARNIGTLTGVTHRFAAHLVQRGRGGLVIVCSNGSLGGTATLAVYTATKAYGLMFGESLWAELKPAGVDVLSVVIGATDTPHLRATLASSGFDPDTISLASPADVAPASLQRLASGPVFVFSELGGETVEADRRRNAVEASTAFMQRLMASH